MSDFWFNLLGVDANRIPEGATTEFMWTYAPQSWGVFVLIAVVLGLMWGVMHLYRREIDACPRALRLTMGVVRILVLLVLVVIFLGPALAVSTQRTLEPYIVLLVDESLSMSLKDRYADDAVAEQVAAALGKDVATIRDEMPDRAALVEYLLKRDDSALVRQLTAKGKLRVLSFSNSVKQRRVIEAQDENDKEEPVDPDAPPAPPADPLPPLNAVGPSTNLAQAIREALRSPSGNPIAAIVIISDGQNTDGDDPRSAADLAQSHGVPIYTVGIGDPSVPQNLRVSEIWAPDSVFREDPFVVQAQIQAEGMSGGAATAELVARPVAEDGTLGSESVLASKTVSLDKSEQRISFEYKPIKAGDFRYSVRVEPQPNELLDTDNVRSMTIKVLSDQAKVLLIAGGPSWEYRMVKTLLTRDKTTNVSCWLQSMSKDMAQEGNTVIERLPTTAEDLFKYDVILLFDPDPMQFDEAWMALLKRFVGEHAGGMLWLAGPQHTTQFFTHFRTRPILDLLPVRIGELGAMDVETLMMTHTTAWPLKVTASGSDHSLLRLSKDPAINRRMWEAMPGVYWTFPAREAKPAAQLLIEHSDPRLKRREGARPLLVAGQYGPGRTVYMGFDGTWRWRKLDEKYFDQYWIQTVRYLVEGRLLGGRKRGIISTDRDIYPVGARVAITARLFDDAYEPLERDSMEAVIRGGGQDGESLTLKPVPNRPGHYQSTMIATHVGLNELAITLDTAGGTPVRIAKQFTTEVPRVEFADPRLDRQMLTDLAMRSGDGRYFQIDQAQALPNAIVAPAETIIIRGRPIELWDTNRALILLVVLLTIEWALRKRFKLL